VLLGVDTGGTYTDAVVLDAAAARVLGKAKALTTKADLSLGIGRAMDAALSRAGVSPAEVGLVSLSTTLATNALVEGQGGRVALVFIGFSDADFTRAGLAEALGSDPVLRLAGGHSHAGIEAAPLDEAALRAALPALTGVVGFAVAAQFGNRNPAHEVRAREIIRAVTGRPVTCAHELSARLNGPRRALTAVLNARLIGMIDGLVAACETHLARLGIRAPLMVVRGDGALMSAAMVRERPIETILSGPAASIVGARWLTGEAEALVSDIGGTTTDIALLRGGLPAIDPEGAQVGGFRTMVEAVAMRTWGLGGDSEVHVEPGLAGGLRLGPRRLVPLSLLAVDHGAMVHDALDRALAVEAVGEFDGRFAFPFPGPTDGLSAREASVFSRLTAPLPLSRVITSRLEVAALERLVARGLVRLAGVTPSDAAHVLGYLSDWDGAAAEKGLALLARRRTGAGERLAPDAAGMAGMIEAQLTAQTADCLLEAAFAEDGGVPGDPAMLARHALMRAGLDGHAGVVRFSAGLGVPVVGLGASAATWYPAVGRRLQTRMVLPADADVANAIGAVVGQVSQRATALVTSPAEGRFVAHLAPPQVFSDRDTAFAAVEAVLSSRATAAALAAGAGEVHLTATRDVKEAEVEGRTMFVEATVAVTATGRPRVAHPAAGTESA
jgi:N-methylhydantoinase A/oxoprolinase/acetone carboxylase beta subunit